jgi:FkbM family methyltransferase
MDNGYARIAKRLLPGTASLLSSETAQSAIQYGEMAAAMLRGKGAGSGWDIAGEIRAAMKFMKPGATVFDVGANLGEWSKAIEQALGRDVGIYLFEPQPTCCEQLKTLFPIGATLTQAAVSQSSGKGPLYTPGGTAGNASLHVRKDTYFADSVMSPIEVDVITLDEFIASKKIAQVDFMKMDIEGNELFALRGATKALEAGTIKAMSFEFGSGNINSRTFFRDLWDLLTGYHYRIFRVLPGGKLVRVQGYSEELEYFRGVTNYIAAI